MGVTPEQLNEVMQQLAAVPAGTHEIAQMVRLTCKHGTQWTIVFCRCGYNGQESAPRGSSCIDPLHSYLAEDCPPSKMNDWQIIICERCPGTDPVMQLAAMKEMAEFLGTELNPADLPADVRAVYERQQGAVNALLGEMRMVVVNSCPECSADCTCDPGQLASGECYRRDCPGCSKSCVCFRRGPQLN